LKTVYGEGNSNIEFIEFYDEEIPMVDIEIEDVHCYFANGLLTHNCAIDYSAQELRIPANLSREPAWMEPFTTGGDVHKSTAIKIFGEENYDKDKRKMAKGANFGILYGMTAPNLAERFKMTLAEGEEFYTKYKKGLPTLFAWEDRIKNRAKKQGVVYTYFGRPRRVRYYFANGQSSFGYRTVVNTTVQGSASDILKVSMLKLWKNLLNHDDYKNDCRWLTTVHDEVDFAIRKEKLNELLPLFIENMRFSLPEWPVVIDCECSIGWNWGELFEIRYDAETGEWHPNLV
jgi:DNA polymerase I